MPDPGSGPFSGNQPHFSPVHTGLAAEARLADLDGLKIAMIHRALEVGDQGRREVSPAYRSNYGGMRMQGDTFGDLSEQLSKQGWRKPRPKDDVLERIHAPSGRFALTVNSGTSDVGKLDGTPSTRNSRGGAGKKAIDTNQGLLFDLPPIRAADDLLTWFLLFYVDVSDDGRIRVEVSLPQIRTGGKIVKWRERIILPPLEPPAGRASAAPTPEVPDVDVPVLRRAT